MIPLRDINPTHKVPVVNVAIIVVNVAAFLYEVSLGPQLEEFFAQYAVIPHNVVATVSGPPFHIAPVFSLFSSMFLHGGWLHLGGNMLYLWIFGDNVEDKLGHGRYLIFYFLCGLAASVVHIVIDPVSTVPTVGASGAISGILAGYLVMFPRARVVTVIPIFVFLQVAELPALVVLGMWFVIQFFNGFISLGYETAGMGGVAWWAHIGGFIAGLVLVIPFRKFR
ncbi:MAG: rhomboid family intramembrane serine protease [Ignavibacteriales bacterium]|nr:rhomboid family intramembrane serine protease [Ignavibacteriales bacterium]